MTVPSYLVAFVLFVTTGVAWWGLVTGFTGASRARFRTELWRLRDEIVDKFVISHSSPKKGALDLLEAVHSCIRQSENFTTLRVMSLYMFWKLGGSPIPADRLELAPGGADEELELYKVRLARICTKYLFTNSMFGPLTILLPLAAFIAKIPRWLRGGSSGHPKLQPPSDVAQRPIRVDVQADAWANRSSDDVRTLACSVS